MARSFIRIENGPGDQLATESEEHIDPRALRENEEANVEPSARPAQLRGGERDDQRPPPDVSSARPSGAGPNGPFEDEESRPRPPQLHDGDREEPRPPTDVSSAHAVQPSK